MTLTDLYSKPMKEVLEKCEIINQQVHTNDKGEVQSIELKYVPKARLVEQAVEHKTSRNW